MKHRLRLPVILAVLLPALLFSSCHRLFHRDIIPPRKFIHVLVDIHLADGMAMETITHPGHFRLDSASLYDAVFRKYGVNRAMFDSTLKYYTLHPDDFQKIYDKVTGRLKEMEDAVEATQKDTIRHQVKRPPPALNPK